MNKHIDSIRKMFETASMPTTHIDVILKCPSFAIYPGSCVGKDGRPPVHHGEVGGLARHTSEVLRNALLASTTLPSVNSAALMIGAVWHDFGKTEEYERLPGVLAFTRRTPQLSHICHGLMMWRESTGSMYLDDPPLFEAVAHIIAAHHGRKEWGSPVEPLTIEALLVHQADMVSVMVECGDNPMSR